ncbi:uncharacterized protein [Nicotiana tomentosiformis]|uniref:uncharacterized protein n=1 Tax=Nicotiana tomentosiformis TaxID=4098 RepID=UPI00388C9D63
MDSDPSEIMGSIEKDPSEDPYESSVQVVSISPVADEVRGVPTSPRPLVSLSRPIDQGIRGVVHGLAQPGSPQAQNYVKVFADTDSSEVPDSPQSWESVNHGLSVYVMVYAEEEDSSRAKRRKIKDDVWAFKRRNFMNCKRLEYPCKLTQKGAKFQWTDACKRSFQALKDRLTSAPVLTLPEGTDGYIIYCDASGVGLGYVLMQHDSGGIGITIQDTATSSLVTEVKERQYEDHMLVHYRDTTPHKEKTPFEITKDGVLRYRGQLCVLNVAGLRRQVMGETHYSRYSIHPGETKMYHDIMEAMEIPTWKWKVINMDFIVGLPRTQRKFDPIWVIVDRLTKLAHLLPVRTTYSAEDYARLYIKEIVRLHGVPISIISDRGAQFTGLRTQVSPMKGVMRFGKKGKLIPQYIGPYRVIRKVGQVAYELDLPSDLESVHPVFHVSMLRKCIVDPSIIVSVDDVQVTEQLSYEETPIAILDRQVQRLRTKDVASVKVLWRNNNVEEITWEAEEDMKSRYPYLIPPPEKGPTETSQP